MGSTQDFFYWFFYGLGTRRGESGAAGIGGWVIFLLIALACLLFVFYDSARRRLPAVGWRLAAVILVLVTLPAVVFRFTVSSTDYQLYQDLQVYTVGDESTCPVDFIQITYPDETFSSCEQLLSNLPPMTAYGDWVFYLGVLGGVLAPVLLLAYLVTYQGLIGCPDGHLYEAKFRECPHISHRSVPVSGGIASPPMDQKQPVQPVPSAAQGINENVGGAVSPTPPRLPKQTAQAWVVDVSTNRRYDLYVDLTRIGRSEDNDIILEDPAVSRRHAQVREAGGNFILADVGSSTGTLLNGHTLHAAQMLQEGDEITVGDTVLKFVTNPD
jgi:hypothetical protein